MDKIIITDLEIYAYHGVNPEENRLGQKFLVSVTAGYDFSSAAENDDISLTIDYGEMCKFIEKLFTSTNFKLVESCAVFIAESLLMNYPMIEYVDCEIKKPWAPIGSHLKYASVKTSKKWHRVYLGLGSNLGDKKENIENAISMLDSDKSKVVITSKFYTTAPVGYTEQDNFLNCVLELKTLLSPQNLISFTMEIERALKRERNIRNGPRTIDIDTLLYDSLISTDSNIIIPHPRMTERLFVLVPLCELAAYEVHPLLMKRFIDIKEELEKIQTL